jgi:hypothetical protein
MIPPNAMPPKTLVIRYKGAEEKLRQQYVYQTYLSTRDRDEMNLVPGNRLVIRFGEEVVGEGQAILVEKTSLEKLSKYDAISAGYESAEAQRKHLLETVLRGTRKAEQAEFYKVLYRWL